MNQESPTAAAARKFGRKARPERFRVAFLDDAAGSIPLDLPPRRMWPIGLLFLAMFALFFGIAWAVAFRIHTHEVRGVFDLVFVLFQIFWVLGWSVGVVILGALAALLLFYGESARIQGGRLVHVPRLGPLRFIVEYDLARVRNLRIEQAGSADAVRIRYDYNEGSSGLGDTMPRAAAERIVGIIESARGAAGARPETVPAGMAAAREEPSAVTPAPTRSAGPRQPLPVDAPSNLALLAANLVPLAGVLLWGWETGQVLLLYWAESAIVAFYTILRMAVVDRLAAVFAVPFFIGHFGAFMAVHFLFVYELFVKGLDAKAPELPLTEVLTGVFTPIWPALAALFASHGVSYLANFLGRREHEGETVRGLMSAPYKRIILMQVTLIFGGWIVMLLRDPRPVLALLVVLKIFADTHAHRREHGTPAGQPASAAVPVRRGD